MFLEILQDSQENTCARVSFLKKLQAWGLQLYQKETLAQVFSCESCKISKNTFSYRTRPVNSENSCFWNSEKALNKQLVDNFVVKIFTTDFQRSFYPKI